MQKIKAQNGITLIALIITIIVMLILVGVSVTVALNGGLFITAKNAVDRTGEEKDREMGLSEGKVVIGGKEYDSYEDYLNKKSASNLPEGWTVTEAPATWTNTNVTPITDGTNIIPLPEGYSISEEEGEYTVSEGLVITDGENEFVWIPVTEPLESSYSGEPSYLTWNCRYTGSPYDSQTTLDYYYGKKSDGSSYYTIDSSGITTNTTSNGTTFDYGYHYNEMVTSVNKYNGFYIGRYETTIDGNKIGSKEGATILLSETSIAQTNNKLCRWWGLYDLQRNSAVKGNGSIVQTNMVWGQQWNAMLTYFTSKGKTYKRTEVATLLTTGKQNAGQAKYTYNNETISDEICNIYDLRGNVLDWTAYAGSSGSETRYARGRLLRFYLFSV